MKPYDKRHKALVWMHLVCTYLGQQPSLLYQWYFLTFSSYGTLVPTTSSHQQTWLSFQLGCMPDCLTSAQLQWNRSLSPSEAAGWGHRRHAGNLNSEESWQRGGISMTVKLPDWTISTEESLSRAVQLVRHPFWPVQLGCAKLWYVCAFKCAYADGDMIEYFWFHYIMVMVGK
jgi:hypothetical protein